MRLPNTFRSLRHYNYRLWFAGQGLSLIGTWMQTMAQQVLIYRLTGSAAALGAISFIGLIPLIPLSLIGGSIADRFPKRSLLLVTQSMMLLQALLLAALTWTGTVRTWHVYVLAFFLGAVQALDIPVRQAFTVELVEGKQDLTNAIALNSTIFNGARMLGPALAGLAVAAVGEGMAFLINGLSFGAVIVGLLLMRNLPHMGGAASAGQLAAAPPVRQVRLAGHLAEGAHYLRSQPHLLVLMSLIAVSSFLSVPYTVLMPVFAGRILHESAQPVVALLCGGPQPLIRCLTPEALPLGILLTMIGLGAVVGSLLVASVPDSVRRGRLLTIGNLGFPLALLLFAMSRSFMVSMLLLVVAGMIFVFQNSLANTLLQLATPDELRGRVMSLYSLAFQGTMRLGAMQSGLVADQIGAPLSVAIGATISLAYGVFVALRYPKLRGMT